MARFCCCGRTNAKLKISESNDDVCVPKSIVFHTITCKAATYFARLFCTGLKQHEAILAKHHRFEINGAAAVCKWRRTST